MILKGLFCMRLNITNERNENFQKLSVNPKVHLIFGTLCYLGFASFFYFACKRSRIYHNIPQRQINLISAKTQYILNNILMIIPLLDVEIMNPILEIFYNQLGPETVFNIWVSFMMIGTMGIIRYLNKKYLNSIISVHRPLYNLIVFMSAVRNLPEFSGYKPRVFPGQPPPIDVRYEPRRMNLPAGAESDWRKIRTRKEPIKISINVPTISRLPEVNTKYLVLPLCWQVHECKIYKCFNTFTELCRRELKK